VPLTPNSPILLVKETTTQILNPAEITRQSVGEKAFGLSALPKAWTLPFILVSSDLCSAYRTSQHPADLLRPWAARIISELPKAGIASDKDLWIRSSGTRETIADRGKFHSESCHQTVDAICSALEKCLGSTADAAADESLYFVVQQAVLPVTAKGHLSNERQYFKENRDWLGEVEGAATHTNFQIHIRNWRNGIVSPEEKSYLECPTPSLLSDKLKPVAKWGTTNSRRIHFEWVCDKKNIYIVQADEASASTGFVPPKDQDKHKATSQKNLKFIRLIDDTHAAKFNKINNVAIYRKLGLPSCPIYVLDDQHIFNAILDDVPPSELLGDLNLLCEHSLIIRTDLDTSDQKKQQLLPRISVRKPEQAIQFLKDTLKKLRAEDTAEPIAFIFHNFVPARSSAFAYAAPSQRRVFIETLWGLPEGLYYNSHDRIVIDVKKTFGNISSEDKAKFSIEYKERFKGFCVAPDESGEWVRKRIAEPYDWSKVINNDGSIREIALQSRRIADEVGHPISIMWFIDVPSAFSSSPIFPWHHEAHEKPSGKKNSRRAKTPLDKTLVINTTNDVEALKKASEKNDKRIRQIRLAPTENSLLRDKSLLKTVGECAVKIDAVIFLEGGTLSHAYYQLLQTKAQIDIAEPFELEEETQQYNKLVRDGILNKIDKAGESFKYTKLPTNEHIQALKNKLVEESIEALDALDRDQIIQELADIEEVIDAILVKLGATRKELKAAQKKKNESVGGFNEGIVLLETTNSQEHSGGGTDLFSERGAGSASSRFVSYAGSGSASDQPSKQWEDRREHNSSTEGVLNLTVSLTQDSWFTEARELKVNDTPPISIQTKVKGERKGSSLTIEISVYTPTGQQLKLPF
jgi:predicted house-cleaning noncanonical NTP pyrophosphatase (MazG superfamily)